MTLNCWPAEAMVLRKLRAFVDEHGYQPSQAELAALLECSQQAIDQALSRLEQRGLVRRAGGKARSVRLTVK